MLTLILAHLRERIFITKTPREIAGWEEYLPSALYSLISHSFLRFEPVPFSIPSEFDVVFFGSPRAVSYFFEQCPAISAHILYACVGERTAVAARSHGVELAFTGKHSSNTSANVAEFVQWCGRKTVLFPSSDRTLGSFAKELPESQVVLVTAYTTRIVPTKVAPADYYVLTSPSNAEAFFSANTPEATAIVIAWGTSTESAIKALYDGSVYVLDDASPKGLAHFLAKKRISQN